MQITHILNNSAAIVNASGAEVIVIGRGITFGKNVGDEIDQSRIDRTFSKDEHHIQELIQKIHPEYFDFATVVIRYAEKKLGHPLSGDAYFIISDHIEGIMQRYRQNIFLPFSFLEDVQLFYKLPYQIAQWTVDYLDAALNINLPDDEIGFIAIDFVNLTSNGSELKALKEIQKLMKLIQECVLDSYPDIDKNSFFYKRFLTHLKYYGYRYIHKKEYQESEVTFKLDIDVQNKYKTVIQAINDKLVEKYQRKMDKTEEKYLVLHLQRLLAS